MSTVVLYTDKLNSHMEEMLIGLCPPELDLRFTQPNAGKKGEFADANCFFVTNFMVTRQVIDQAPNLKLIQRTGVGLDNVDVDYATQKGIPVSICKGFNATSVAELAILEMLALYRHLLTLDPLTRKGEWHTWTYRHDSYELFGKTVGVVGGGAIGREVMKRVRAFETKVLYHDVNRLPKDVEESMGVTYAGLDALLKASDVVTLHLPWLPSTEKIIGEAQFAMMKPSAILINTARGPIVDQAALVDALKTGKIWGAACDAFMDEPADPDDPLFKLDNAKLIVTPHIGAATYDNFHRCFSFALENALKISRGETPGFVVNQQ